MTKREKDLTHALRQIINIMGPLNYSPDRYNCGCCEGCEFEMTEATRIAMNILAGLDEDAHWGAPHWGNEITVCRQVGRDNCPICIASQATRHDHQKAWTKAGLHWIDGDGTHHNMPRSWRRAKP